MRECGCGSTVFAAYLWNRTADIYSDTRQLISCTHTAKQKHLHARFPHLSELPRSTPFPVMSHQPSWGMHVYWLMDTHVHRWRIPIKLRAVFQYVCTDWHLVYSLRAFAHPLHPSKEACHWASSLPQVTCLELTCYLSASCAESRSSPAQGAPCFESHTHQTRMPVSPGIEIGQEAGLETPLMSLSDALVFSCSLLFSTNTHIKTATFSHKHWSVLTDWVLLLTTAMVGLNIAASTLFWVQRLVRTV